MHHGLSPKVDQGFSPSQPQPASASATSASATSASATSASATMFFFPNDQLTKENLSPKTDNICIDGLYQQLQSMKGPKKCFQLSLNDKYFLFLNPYSLGKSS